MVPDDSRRIGPTGIRNDGNGHGQNPLRVGRTTHSSDDPLPSRGGVSDAGQLVPDGSRRVDPTGNRNDGHGHHSLRRGRKATDSFIRFLENILKGGTVIRKNRVDGTFLLVMADVARNLRFACDTHRVFFYSLLAAWLSSVSNSDVILLLIY